MPKLLSLTKSVEDTHTDGVMCLCVAVNENEKNAVFSGGMDGKIRQWSTTGEAISTIEAHTETVNNLISVNNKLYSCSDDKSIKVWNTTTNKEEGKMTHDDSVNNMIIVGDVMYSCDDAGTIKIHNLTTFNCDCTFPAAADALNCLAIFEQLLWSGGDDGFLRLWNVAPDSLTDGQMVPVDNISVIDTDDTVMINNLAIQDNNIWVSIGITDLSCLQCRNVKSGSLLTSISLNDWPRTIILTSMFFFVACDDGNIYSWVMGGDDKLTPSALSEALEGGSDPIMDMVLCGKNGASTSDGKINFWESIA